MPSGDVFAIKLHMTYNGQQCRPGFYLIEGGGAGGDDPVQDAADAVRLALGEDPLGGFSENCSLEAIEAQDVQPATARSRLNQYSPAVAGDVAEDNPLPPQDSMLIGYQSLLKPKKGVFAADGRIYMPGLPSTGQISGFLTVGAQTALNNFKNLLFIPFVGDGTAYALACISFTPASNPRTIRAFNLAVVMTVSNQVAIQRRRRPGTGI